MYDTYIRIYRHERNITWQDLVQTPWAVKRCRVSALWSRKGSEWAGDEKTLGTH